MDPKMWIDINTESFQYSLDHFVIPDHYETALQSVLIPHGVIMDRVEKLAKLIVQEATGPLVFIKVKSYSGETSGNVKLSLTDEECKEFSGKNILIVEDIIDTGKTMVQLLAKLKKFSPESVKVASLLIKKTPLSNGYIPDYVGFAIPNAFVVGYALDYNEYFRDLDHICVISDVGKEKYAIKN
ncbi:unnamed protein product [Mortierella alpina]